MNKCVIYSFQQKSKKQMVTIWRFLGIFSFTPPSAPHRCLDRRASLRSDGTKNSKAKPSVS